MREMTSKKLVSGASLSQDIAAQLRFGELAIRIVDKAARDENEEVLSNISAMLVPLFYEIYYADLLNINEYGLHVVDSLEEGEDPFDPEGWPMDERKKLVSYFNDISRKFKLPLRDLRRKTYKRLPFIPLEDDFMPAEPADDFAWSIAKQTRFVEVMLGLIDDAAAKQDKTLLGLLNRLVVSVAIYCAMVPIYELNEYIGLKMANDLDGAKEARKYIDQDLEKNYALERRGLRRYLREKIAEYQSHPELEIEIAYDIAGLLSDGYVERLRPDDPYVEVLSLARNLELPEPERGGVTWKELIKKVRALK